MSKFKKILIYLVVICVLIGGVSGYLIYKMTFVSNVKKDTFLYIPTGATFEMVLDSLKNKDLLVNYKSFIIVSKIKKYNNYVKSGKYNIKKNQTNWQLINNLRSGNQVPVNVVIPSVRTLDKLCEAVAKYFEFDSNQLYEYLTNEEFLKKNDLNNYTIISMFIPNTYQFFWNTSPEQFFERIKKEYDNYWTEDKKAKAHKFGLTPFEVSVLASIVQAEQMQFSDERPKIAALYLNRLKINMPLQSDPTLIFATGDFTIKRVYDFHKKIVSPYNTYMYLGLPPGPILIPEISSLDAVLNPDKNDYLYMCAKDDFSGYHYFAKDLTQHMIYANMYHNALNKLKIK